MERPLVSVLMTSYNREKYIAESIESVLRSTYDNFELIIVDNCSNDKTVEIVKQYALKHNRIRVYVNSENIGQFRNRNLVATYAKGKYLKYLDSDDVLYPTGLEVLVGIMEQFPEAGYGQSLRHPDKSRPCPFVLSSEDTFAYHYETASGIFDNAPLESIIKKEAFEKVNGFDIDAICGDFAFWLKIACFYPIVLAPNGIGWYRVHADQEMQKARMSSKVAFEYLKAEEMLISENSVISSDLKRKILQKNRVLQLKFCLFVLRRLQIKNFFSLLKMHHANPKSIFKITTS